MASAGSRRKRFSLHKEWVVCALGSGLVAAALGYALYTLLQPAGTQGDPVAFLVLGPALAGIALALFQLRTRQRLVAAEQRIDRLQTDLVHETDQRKRAEAALEFHVETDPLTSIATSRYFTSRAELAVARARRAGTQTTILLLGVDGFDDLVQRLGPVGGDDILRQLGKICRDAVREVDLPARLDHDVFAILLEDTSVDGAKIVANRIRRGVTETKSWSENGTAKVTVGIGMIEMDARNHFLNDALKWAREALGHAQNAGPGKICVAREAANDPVTLLKETADLSKVTKALAHAA